MYYVLKLQQISLLPNYIIQISRGIFLRMFKYVNPRLYKVVNYCDIMDNDLTCCHRILFASQRLSYFKILNNKLSSAFKAYC